MKRIFASLIVITAIAGMGVLASTAYFQFQGQGLGFTLTTGSASLQQTGASGTLGTSGSIQVGPGFTGYECVSILNDGQYTLSVTESLAFTAGDANLEKAVSLSLAASTSGCPESGSGTAYSLDKYQNNPQPIIASLAPGATVYVTHTLAWIETGTNQNGLEKDSLTVNGTITGQTLP
jgi:hypothetical protein